MNWSKVARDERKDQLSKSGYPDKPVQPHNELWRADGAPREMSAIVSVVWLERRKEDVEDVECTT